MAHLQETKRGGFIPPGLGWTLSSLMLAVFVIGRLVGPRIPDDQQKKWCAVNVHITAIFGVSLNCDAQAFMLDATHPSALIEPDNPLQSKPGMPIVAWAIALPFQPLNAVVPRLARDVRRADIDSIRVDNALKAFGPAYVAYFILNLLILCCSFYLFRRIVQAGRPDRETETVVAISVSVGTLMIATYPITNYLLSPHTVMFNALVPLLAIVCAMRANTVGITDARFAATVGAVVGFGMTVYTLFFMVTVTVLLFAGLHALRERVPGAAPRGGVRVPACRGVAGRAAMK
jgi:hypothetical protein